LFPEILHTVGKRPGPRCKESAGTVYPLIQTNVLDRHFCAVKLSGTAHLHLTAATTGLYAGIALFQSRDNTKML
jgi:hypothetical protein